MLENSVAGEIEVAHLSFLNHPNETFQYTGDDVRGKNILWYMSKEIDEIESSVERGEGVTAAAATSTMNNNTKRRRKRIFSFYAPQMLAGNTPPEHSVYPSQTSALLRQDNEWRTLRTTLGMDVPVVEVLD